VGETTSWSRITSPNGIEFELSSKAKQIRAEVPVELEGRRSLPLWRAGFRPAARRRYAGRGRRPPGGRAIPATSRRGGRRKPPSNERTRSKTCPEADANGVATFPPSAWQSRRPRRDRRKRKSLSAWRKPGGRAVEAQAGAASGALPTAADRLSRCYQTRASPRATRPNSTCCLSHPDGKQLAAQRPALRNLMKVESRYQWYRPELVLGI